MLTTFTTFTQRHPRFVAIFGASLFTMGVTLWGFVLLDSRPASNISNVFVTDNVQKEEEVLDEKIAVLDSLKSTEPDTVPLEEKIAVLDSLKSTEPDTMTEEEKLRILAELATSEESDEAPQSQEGS